MAMGSPAALARRKKEGLLNARQRIEYLLDPGSFLESGLFATSYRPEVRDTTPADGRVVGYGRLDGRPVAVISNDFSVLKASSSVTNTRKLNYIKETATRRGLPILFFAESGGGRIPDIMGAQGLVSAYDRQQFRRVRETPWASAILGQCYGSGTWYAAMSDFVVMRRGAVMGVASSRLTSLATSETSDPEEFGGWKVHSEVSGMASAVVDTDEEALDALGQFLSYLPSHSGEVPPVVDDAGADPSSVEEIAGVLPPRRNQAYDMHKIITRIVDIDSMFELSPRYARSAITCLARIRGHTLGVVANNPMVRAGVIDGQVCLKVTRFLVMCDTFNIPLVFLTDQPGFMISQEEESQGAARRIMMWMNALLTCTVPKVSIIIRKSYGQGALLMGAGGNADELACWPTAEIGFMDPEFATTLVHGIRRQDDGPLFDEKLAEVARESSAYAMAATYDAQYVIEPGRTREYISEMLTVHRNRATNGLGDHLLRAWPPIS